MALYNMFVNEKAGLRHGIDFIVFSKGDDFTVMYQPYVPDEFIKAAYYKYFLKSVPEGYSKERIYGLGQVLKMLKFGGPNSISFCSLRAWYISQDEHEIILTRDIEKFNTLTKYSRKIKTLSGIQRQAYYVQQAISILSTYKGIKIFELLAEAYLYASIQINTIKTYQQAIKYANTIIADIRKQIKQGNERYEDENYRLIYGIKHKKRFYKIKDAYWDTMKYLQEMSHYNLTPEQFDYVNQQIESEFSYEYFKSSMGLNSADYKQCLKQLKVKQLIDTITN